jgi:hypothetical protein
MAGHIAEDVFRRLQEELDGRRSMLIPLTDMHFD